MKRFVLFLAAFFWCIAAQAQIGAGGTIPGGFPQDTVQGVDPNAPVIVYPSHPAAGDFPNNRLLSPSARFVITDNGAGNTLQLDLATVDLLHGGTGATTAQGALDNIMGASATGDIVYYNGTHWVHLPVGSNTNVLTLASGVPSWAAATSGAPIGASYITAASEAGLTAERVATQGTGITITDGGANSTLTIAVDTTVVATTNNTLTMSGKTLTSPIFAWNSGAGVQMNGSVNHIALKWADWTVGNLGTVTFPDVANNAANVLYDITNQTITGVKTFNSGDLKLAGNNIITSAGNTATLAGTGTDTIVEEGATETLTNKTLTSPAIGTQITLNQTTANYVITWDNPSTSGDRAYHINDINSPGAFMLYNGATALYTAGGIYYADGTGMHLLAPGTAGQTIVSGGSGAPSWGAAGGSTTPGGLATGAETSVPSGNGLLAINPQIFTPTETGSIQYSQGYTASTNLVQRLCVGPDGNIWAASKITVLINKISTAGLVLAQFSTGLTKNGNIALCAGPDGNLWGVEQGGTGAIFKCTTAGTITEFTTGLTASNNPYDICVGPDGNLWGVEHGATPKVFACNTSGTILEFSTGLTHGSLTSICAGPDGNLWGTEGASNTGAIFKCTTAGTITEFTTGLNASRTLNSICAGPDGNLWVGDGTSGNIYRCTTGGTITAFASGHIINAICAGPDGNIWGLSNGNNIVRCTTTGIITVVAVASTNGVADAINSICTGPDGGLWIGNTTGPGPTHVNLTYPISSFAAAGASTPPNALLQGNGSSAVTGAIGNSGASQKWSVTWSGQGSGATATALQASTATGPNPTAETGGTNTSGSGANGIIVNAVTTATTGNAAGYKTGSFTLTEAQFQPILSTRVVTNGIITSTRIWVGFVSTDEIGSGTPAATNLAAFRYDTTQGDTTWKAYTCDNSASTTIQDTSVTVTGGTKYDLCVDLSTSGHARFYINGSLVADITAHIPTASGTMGWQETITNTASGATQLGLGTLRVESFFEDEPDNVAPFQRDNVIDMFDWKNSNRRAI